ncbi:MAG: HEAT repeat domain-containing protein [Promethearchaeota archaeon]
MSSDKISELVDALITDDDKEIINELISIGRKDINQLTNALRHENWHARWKIAEILGEIKDKRASPFLIQSIKEDKNSYVREVCVESLGKIRDKTTIPFLISLLKDRNPQVRIEAALALGKMKAVEAVPDLCNNLSANSSGVRWAAVRALGAIKDAKDAVIPLISLLDEEKESNVRDWVIWTLGEIGDSQATKPLIKVLKEDKNPDIRQEADLALTEIAKKYGYSKKVLLAKYDCNNRNSK